MNRAASEERSGILVIGWDSADFDLVRRWAAQGRLPVIAGLMERGTWRKLDSTADVGSGSVWPSFFTGTNPAQHRGLHARRLQSGSYRVIHEAEVAGLKRPPFWERLSRDGRRIAVLDVPKTQPAKGLNGIQLVAWGVHSPSWHLDASPPEAAEEVSRRFGKYPVPDCDEFIPSGASELREFYAALIAGIEKKEAVSRYLLAREPWDLFVTVFAEPHCAGHNFWHLMDTDHPKHDPVLARELGDALLNVYAGIDAAAGRILEERPGATVLIVSPEGMGPNYTGSHLLPDVLRRLGMAGQSRAWSPAGRWGPHAIRNLRSLLPLPVLKVIERLKRFVPRSLWYRSKAYLMSAGNDWRKSRAFCSPSDFNGAIRINLEGREPNGRVKPGSEYDALCDELISELGRLVNLDSGEPAVAEVVRVDRRYAGPYLGALPDLVVKWRGDAPIRGLSSPRIGVVTGENRHERTGAHRAYGFVIAAGEGIAKSGGAEAGSIMDLAPTILHLLGRPIPPEMEGRVLSDLIEANGKLDEPA